MGDSGRAIDGITEFLGTAAVFSALEPMERAALAHQMQPITLAGGAILMAEGDQADDVFLVRTGRLRVVVDRENGVEDVVAEIGPGEVVGEMALLSDEPRSATVRAVRDTTALRLGRDDFIAFVRDHPRALFEITRTLVRRLRRTSRREAASSVVKTVAVLPAGDGADLGGFARRLADAAGRWGGARVVDRQRVEEHLGSGSADVEPEAPRYAEMARWLNELDQQPGIIIYVGDHEATTWTRHCGRQADRILLTADATGSPDPGPVEALLDTDAPSGGARVELVLLHRPGTVRPRRTDRWLRPRSVARHHHVLSDSRSQHDRVARAITGRGVGLVLSGGGARGFAHLGVIKALLESGVPVDVIGGASIGAATAASYAIGWSYGEMVERARGLTVDSASLIDLTVPVVALGRGARLTNAVRRAFGDTCIEDLWTDFFCVSSDLSAGELRVHRMGPVWRAVRSSVAIPGTFPPVRADDGHVLVDGGVMNNIPVDVMNSFLDGGLILAVDLRAGIELPSEDLPDDGIVSGWHVVGRRLNPLTRTSSTPPMIDTLLRATEIASGRHDQDADLVFRPPVGDFGLLDFKPHERIVEVGYRCALDVLAGWHERPGWCVRV